MQHEITIMQLRGVVKGFPNGTVALRGVDLDIEQGKVHGLLGANGAGKSTLIKILSGAFGATRGDIIWRGKPVVWNSPKAANDMGVATVHQHIPLVPTLSILENIFLGNTGWWRRSSTLKKEFDELCQRVGYLAGSGCDRWLPVDRGASDGFNSDGCRHRRRFDRHGRTHGFAGCAGA